MALSDLSDGQESQTKRNRVAPHPNSAARSLVQNSFDRGWDPTQIWNQESGSYGESLLPWDRARDTFDRNIQNQDGIPGGVPAYNQSKDSTGGPTMNENITFE